MSLAVNRDPLDYGADFKMIWINVLLQLSPLVPNRGKWLS
jgi:hypothetical protein